MNAWPESSALIDQLSSSHVSAYLRSTGWQKVDTIRDVATVWSTRAPDGLVVEVILPVDRSVDDFDRRMIQTLHTIAVIEQRALPLVASDISAISFDIVRMSFKGDAFADGAVPIETGVRLVAFTRDLILAAASVSVVQRAVLPARKPDLALGFLQKVKLGQTEKGSYVFTVRSPARPELSYQASLLPDSNGSDLPYERRVMLTLANGLDAARHAAIEAEASGSTSAFSEAVNLGVSATLCDALSGMLESPETKEVGVDFTFSPLRPENTNAPRSVSFHRDMGPVFSQASKHFRNSTPQEVELTGEVVRLERPVGFQGGAVAISAIHDGQAHIIELPLDAPDYINAIDAHRGEVRVRCRGELVRKGSRYSLINARDFELL